MIKKFFSSTKSAIALLAILILASIIGTIIPQNCPEQAYIHKYGANLYRFFKLLSLTDIYHSWWFIGILALLGIHIIVCSANRLPAVWRLISQPKKVVDTQYISSLQLKNIVVFPKDINEAFHSLRVRLIKKNYRLSVMSQQSTKIVLFAEKGRFGRLGSFITHLGILIILSGGVIGGLLGFKEYVEINEKETIDVPQTNFRLRVDDFDVEYYHNSKMPKDYKSRLTIIDGGKDVLTKTIEVNHPLIYKGVWFYQSSYGVGKVKGVTINVRKRDNDNKGQDFEVKIGDRFTILETGMTIKVSRFVPDFVLSDTESYSRSEEFNNPAAKLEVSDKQGLKFSQWVFYKFPNYHQSQHRELEFNLVGFDVTQYTGLQLVNDPGVPIVWTGCGLLMTGLILSFFVFHRRLWVILTKKGKDTTVLIGGMTNKNKVDFEQEFKGLVYSV